MTSKPLDELVQLIDDRNQVACGQLLREYATALTHIPGSKAKHQAWPGGWIDHVTEVMNYIYFNHQFIASTERMACLPEPLRYTLSDALLCGFCHDVDKLAVYAREAWPLDSPPGPLETKAERRHAQLLLLEHFGFALTARHVRALELAEGVRDSDYSRHTQLMTPLGFAVHQADLYSAVWGQFPLADNDPFGAQRFRASNSGS